MTKQAVALFGDVAHADGFAAGRLARVQTAVGSDAPRAIKSRDRFECVNYYQRGKQPDARMGSQKPDARILFGS